MLIWVPIIHDEIINYSHNERKICKENIKKYNTKNRPPHIFKLQPGPSIGSPTGRSVRLFGKLERERENQLVELNN